MPKMSKLARTAVEKMSRVPRSGFLPHFLTLDARSAVDAGTRN
jgi:hypothetical protein